MFKAAIDLAGRKYSNTHNLAKLASEARAAGLSGHWEDLNTHIQCTPGIRYGEEDCDRDAALIAHYATLQLTITLQEGGAAFRSNLAIQRTLNRKNL
jgi:hypothetical protein